MADARMLLMDYMCVDLYDFCLCCHEFCDS